MGKVMTQIAITALAAALLESCVSHTEVEVEGNGEQGGAIFFYNGSGHTPSSLSSTPDVKAKAKDIADNYCRPFNRSAKLPLSITSASWSLNPVNFDCVE
jgi:hypothetical protein